MILHSTNDKIEMFLNTTHENYVYSNKILYDMCKESRSHTNAHEIVAKVLIIGRTYAAAIERRKDTHKKVNDFYYDVVAQTMLNYGKEIDERIACLEQYSRISDENISDIIETHGFLTHIFQEMTGMEKRSLASKYLHFHLPELFYIYDSRACQSIRRYVKKERSTEHNLNTKLCDLEYSDFNFRMFELQKYIENKFDRLLSPRDMDNLLLYFA